jgi:hypothetical protein
MKKIIIPVLTAAFLILSGCYKGDDTATVKLSLGNMPVAKNVQPRTFLDRIRSFFVKEAFAADPDVYIAAMKDDDVLLKVSLYSGEIINNTVELEVPAGNNITILVVTTDTSNIVNYYNYSIVDLEAGKTADVSITLKAPDWCEDACEKTIYIDDGCIAVPVSWDLPGVATKYYIEDGDGALLYEGYENQTKLDSGTYYLYIEFIPFNIKTTGFGFYINGC